MELIMKGTPSAKKGKASGRRSDITYHCDQYNSAWCRGVLKEYDLRRTETPSGDVSVHYQQVSRGCSGFTGCPKLAWKESTTNCHLTPENLERWQEERERRENRVIPHWLYTSGLGDKIRRDLEETGWELIDYRKEVKVKVSSLNFLIDPVYCHWSCKQDPRHNRAKCGPCKVKRKKFIREIARLWAWSHYRGQEGPFMELPEEDEEREGMQFVYSSYQYSAMMQKVRELTGPVEILACIEDIIATLMTWDAKPLTIIDQLKGFAAKVEEAEMATKELLDTMKEDLRVRQYFTGTTRKHGKEVRVAGFEYGNISFMVEEVVEERGHRSHVRPKLW